MKFENILYWCEFPARADWKELNSLFVSNGMKAKCFLCVESVEEFRHWKNQLRHYKGIDVAGAWPSIPLDKGYWFSGFVDKQEIDFLDRYKWMNLKIDIEPPFKYFKALNVVNALFWVLIHLFRRAKNNLYLREKLVETVKKNEMIISTFPLPDFVLRRYGFFRNPRFKYSFMFYSSMIPFVFRPLYRIYYRWFMRRALKRSKETYFAVGLISKGIFNSEPQYSNAKQLTSDLKFLMKHKAKNLVVYSIGGITERKNPEDWVKALKEFS